MDITLVVKNRDHILGELNMNAENPGVILTETGKAVVERWKKTGELQAKYNSAFHNINILAKEITEFYGAAKILSLANTMQTHNT